LVVDMIRMRGPGGDQGDSNSIRASRGTTRGGGVGGHLFTFTYNSVLDDHLVSETRILEGLEADPGAQRSATTQ
jgi:hypothetical protein